MRRIELESGAWVTLTEGWLAPDEGTAIFECMLRELSWEQRHIVLFGKRILQPRLIAWAGELPYRYSGQTLEPRAWPGLVRRLLERVNETTGAAFNHVLVNRYRDGSDSMGYHADAEPELGPDPVVATVSLGAARRFLLRRHAPRPAPVCDDVRKARREAPLVLPLAQGSLLVMGGTCQRHYRHAIPRENAQPTGERISLTFRRLLAAPAPSSAR
jgi:alkylated DNA repair dioxygenase AlkB